MSDTAKTPGEGGGPQAGATRSLPIAAIAGALVLVGLVGIALYRRSAGQAAGAAGADSGAAPSTTAAGAEIAGAEAADKGAAIAVKAPLQLSPEAAILAERYRCVCGCNDPLGVCTCRIPGGSEDMKEFLQDLARQGRTPGEADLEMTAKFGAAALLANPAPPQTQPSHAAR